MWRGLRLECWSDEKPLWMKKKVYHLWRSELNLDHPIQVVIRFEIKEERDKYNLTEVNKTSMLLVMTRDYMNRDVKLIPCSNIVKTGLFPSSLNIQSRIKKIDHLLGPQHPFRFHYLSWAYDNQPRQAIQHSMKHHNSLCVCVFLKGMLSIKKEGQQMLNYLKRIEWRKNILWAQDTTPRKDTPW